MKEDGKEVTTSSITTRCVLGILYGFITAKFLDSIIKLYVPDSYTIQSTDDLLTKLKIFDSNYNYLVVSYDVKSLLTNILLSNTINIMADYKYSSHHNEHPLIKKNIFVKLMDLSTQGVLLYHNKLYQQIDGAAMGCPLVPTMANFLLKRMETTWKQETTVKVFVSHCAI